MFEKATSVKTSTVRIFVLVLFLSALSGCDLSHDTQKPHPIPSLSSDGTENSEDFLHDVSLGLYIAQIVKKDTEWTDEEVGKYFKWIVSNSWYTLSPQMWWSDNANAYLIHKSDIQKCLDVYYGEIDFDYVAAFGQLKVKGDWIEGYDAQSETLVLPMIGGYGGGVLYDYVGMTINDEVIILQFKVYMDEERKKPPLLFTTEFSQVDYPNREFRLVRAYHHSLQSILTQ